MNNPVDQRTCSECDRPLFGRTDKKFCSDGCRNAYNNRVNSDATNFVRNVNNSLRKNRRLLVELNGKEHAEIHRDKLLKQGFDFDYYTSTRKTANGQVYYYCYDQGYELLPNGIVSLVEKMNN